MTQWPLFWLEVGPCFEGLTFKHRGNLGFRYLYMVDFLLDEWIGKYTSSVSWILYGNGNWKHHESNDTVPNRLENLTWKIATDLTHMGPLQHTPDPYPTVSVWKFLCGFWGSRRGICPVVKGGFFRATIRWSKHQGVFTHPLIYNLVERILHCQLKHMFIYIYIFKVKFSTDSSSTSNSRGSWNSIRWFWWYFAGEGKQLSIVKSCGVVLCSTNFSGSNVKGGR